jgi:hypothetical protein
LLIFRIFHLQSVLLKQLLTIWMSLLLIITAKAQQGADTEGYSFNFIGAKIEFTLTRKPMLASSTLPDKATLQAFYEELNTSDYQSIIKALLDYREKRKPDDWVFYQLIRKTAENISPKAANYYQYTLYKWFLLLKTGYYPLLAVSNNVLLLYIQSEEIVYNIPSHISEGKQFVCLNYHDYNGLDFAKYHFTKINVEEAASGKSFSYKITQMPDFPASEYEEKDIGFEYYGHPYHFKVKLNNQVRSIFKNYPVSDYSMHFNVPVSNQTYSSLIPALKENIKGMSQQKGVDYLMRFTRYSFLFEKDTDQFGKEKRMSPEETLLYDRSDCEDRAALFFYLVKEIYNLPMIVLAYPSHVTIGVQFDKPVGATIEYNGKKYVICEPTPQRQDLRVGQIARSLRHTSYEVAYVYTPSRN